MEAESGDGWVLVADGRFSIFAPMICRRNPQPMRETDCSELVVFEMFARSGEKGINGGFVNRGAFLKTFALDSPVIAGSGASHQVNTSVFTAEIAASRKIVPEPDIGEKVSVARVSLQITLHQSLELVAFVAFGERVFSEMSEDGLKLALAHIFRMKWNRLGKGIKAVGRLK